jgi:F0F1-type ATP synthase assembly protein I
VTAPGASRYRSDWYRSGARRRTVTLDDARRMSNSAWVNSSRLITGLLLYTGLGWLVSRWVGHQALLMAIGAMVGLALSYYLMFTTLAHETRADDERQRQDTA